MKKLIILLIQPLFFFPFTSWSSNTPVTTPSASEALLSDHMTASSVGERIGPRPLSANRKRSQERTYETSELTGPTGINALAAKTGRLLEEESFAEDLPPSQG